MQKYDGRSPHIDPFGSGADFEVGDKPQISPGIKRLMKDAAAANQLAQETQEQQPQSGRRSAEIPLTEIIALVQSNLAQNGLPSRRRNSAPEGEEDALCRYAEEIHALLGLARVNPERATSRLIGGKHLLTVSLGPTEQEYKASPAGCRKRLTLYVDDAGTIARAELMALNVSEGGQVERSFFNFDPDNRPSKPFFGRNGLANSGNPDPELSFADMQKQLGRMSDLNKQF